MKTVKAIIWVFKDNYKNRRGIPVFSEKLIARTVKRIENRGYIALVKYLH